MFGKRKYDRKKGTRKSFRGRTRKKSRILKPVEPIVVPEKPVFNASGSSLYSWIHIPPVKQRPFNDTNKKARGGFTKSLREKCAEIVGANADAISPSYLDEGAWSCWKSVWLAILKNGADSPEIFRMFAQRFGDQITFPCHSTLDADLNLVYSSLQELRNNALNACLIPFAKKHRVENIFSNVSIKDFTAFIRGLNSASVVIDCSKMPSFTAAEILSLFNIPNLKGLDLSGNRQIDDQLLYTIKSRLTSRGSDLEVLNLSGCPHISETGLFNLLEGCGSANVSYVESDIRLFCGSTFEKSFYELNSSNPADIVTGTQWKLVKREDKIYMASKYKIGLKYHYLSRQMNKKATTGILWDLKFFSSTMEPLDKHAEDLFCTAWKQRYHGAMNRPLDPPFIYVKDPNIKVTLRPSTTEPTEALTVFERAGRVSSSESRVSKKPKMINTSAQAFFFGS